MKVTGVITKIQPVEEGVSKAGKEWKKLTFVLETSEEYNNIYAFEVFGGEKVDNFVKFNKVGQAVDVDFNVSCNEWKGKYFTSLQAWKIFKAEEAQIGSGETPAEDDLPF
jgi:hypothetical protein